MKVLKIKYDIITGANVELAEVTSTVQKISRNDQQTQKLPQAPYIKVKGVHNKKQRKQKSQTNTNPITNQIAITAQTDVAGNQAYQCTQEKIAQIRTRQNKKRAIKQERDNQRQLKSALPEINVEQKLPIVLELSSTSNFAKTCASCYDDQQKQRFYECARALYYNGK